jgi:hypothetical protein
MTWSMTGSWKTRARAAHLPTTGALTPFWHLAARRPTVDEELLDVDGSIERLALWLGHRPVHRTIGHRRNTDPWRADLLNLNRIFALLQPQTNLFSPQQKLVEHTARVPNWPNV